MMIEQGTPLRGLLSKAQISLIVNMVELTGKLQGVSAYKDLGALLAALEAFEAVEAEPTEQGTP